MQEEFRDDPWKLLVGCILLNQVSARSARPIWEKLFERWPSWTSLLKEPRESVMHELTNLFRPLGFQNRRAERVLRMTEDVGHQYRELKNDRMQIDPSNLYGCGKYASDSYNMFVKGQIVEDVEDKELKNYVRWAREKHGKESAGSAASG
jgi:methyl-CpG-binding domain protein 4